MKLRTFACLAALTNPLVALAHPGHPDHDFEWDFAPAAAVLVIFGSLVAGAVWNSRRRQSS